MKSTNFPDATLEVDDHAWRLWGGETEIDINAKVIFIFQRDNFWGEIYSFTPDINTQFNAGAYFWRWKCDIDLSDRFGGSLDVNQMATAHVQHHLSALNSNHQHLWLRPTSAARNGTFALVELIRFVRWWSRPVKAGHPEKGRFGLRALCDIWFATASSAHTG